jgi:hypothetical protein
MSNTITITNNTKRIRCDLTSENVLKYKITISDITNVSDNYVNIKFFINTDNTDGSGNIFVDSYLNDEKVRSEIFNFKFTDFFVDKLIKMNTETITIGIDYNILSGLDTGEIVGSITELNLPLVSRIYGSEDVPIKTSDGKLLVDLSGQFININGLTFNNNKLYTYDISANNLLTTINSGIGNKFTGNVYGNVVNNGTITGNSFSSSFTWTRGDYNRYSILSYTDSSYNIMDSISIFTTANNGDILYLDTIVPTIIQTYRHACFKLNLLPYNSISIRNNSSTSISGVYATLTCA